ncbi:hypothetical protein ENTCAN_06647 [Enterobacter cancerogenus ATCC 35316]|nr:hypothetical protein ENTCAN_06647 [Enterobacter cancerogenus ATCC 35316]
MLIYFPQYKTARERDDESYGAGVYHKLRQKKQWLFFVLFRILFICVNRTSQ